MNGFSSKMITSVDKNSQNGMIIERQSTGSHTNLKSITVSANSWFTLPDFRQVLYWKPDGVTSEHDAPEYGIRTSDLYGIFRIELRGITSLGRMVETEKEFVVIQNPGKNAER